MEQNNRLFESLKAGTVAEFEYKGETFLANNLRGHWEIIHIGKGVDPSAYYHAPITSMTILYKIADDLLQKKVNLRYNENGKIDSEFPLDNDNQHEY